VSGPVVQDRDEWIPDCGEVIWIDCNPQAGREMRDHQPKSFDWQARRARPHPMGRVDDAVLVEARHRLNQIIELS